MRGRPVTPDFSPSSAPTPAPAPPIAPTPQSPPVPTRATQYLIIFLLSPFYAAGGLIAMAAFDRDRVTAAVITTLSVAALLGISRYLTRLPPDRRPFGLRPPIVLTLFLLAFLLGFFSYAFLEYDAHRPHHRFE